MARWITRIVLALLVLAVVANAGLLGAVWLTQDPAPRPLTGQRIFEASRPAVMLIQANYDVTVSVPEVTVPASSQKKLEQQLIAMLDAGRLADTQAAIEQAAINLVVDHPQDYFVPGPTRATDQVALVASGSGFFVTEDGYLVTAAHVVSTDNNEIRKQIVDVEKTSGGLTDSRTELQQVMRRDTGLTLNDSQLDKLLAWGDSWLQQYVTVDKVDVKYYLASGTVEAGQHLVSTGTRLSLVKSEAVPPGRDVAVMKADVTSVPALPLATGQPSGATEVVGYPRVGYLGEEAQMDATVPPTLTTGHVSDQRSMDGGWTAIGTDASMTHGNSGGPVLDARGRVVGMASFVETDSSGTPVAGENFFVPASVIQQTLDSASVKPAAGTLTGLYYQALSQRDFHHYRHELALLSQVQARSAWHAYVKDEISTTQAQVLSGHDQTPPDLRGYQPIGLGVLGAVALLTIVTLTAMRLRRRPPALPAAATPTPGDGGVTATAAAEPTTALSVDSPEPELVAVAPGPTHHNGEPSALD